MGEFKGDGRNQMRLLMGSERVVKQLGLLEVFLKLWGSNTLLDASYFFWEAKGNLFNSVKFKVAAGTHS